jgi:hypothetical protein
LEIPNLLNTASTHGEKLLSVTEIPEDLVSDPDPAFVGSDLVLGLENEKSTTNYFVWRPRFLC